jgi:hypothetical protein
MTVFITVDKTMPPKQEKAQETTLRVKRRTAVVLSTLAKAKETTADELIWQMLQDKYANEVKLVMQLSGKLDDDGDAPDE